MQAQQRIRRVPWTCRWGVFGGSVSVRQHMPRGFNFWRCQHPQMDPAEPLGRDTCEECPWWEAVDRLERRED